MMNGRWWGVAVLALVQGCGWVTSPCGPGGPEAARMALLASDVEASRIAREQGMASVIEVYFEDDAVFLPMNWPTLYGREDIGLFFSGTERITLSWTPADAEVSLSCDMGYSYGAWTAFGDDPDGNAFDLRGKYFAMWRPHEGGWRVGFYMQNADPETE